MKALLLQPQSSLQQFLKLESAGSIVLCAAAAMVLVLVNSPLETLYTAFGSPAGGSGRWSRRRQAVGAVVKDGLMAISFMLVGLEVKRAVVEDELSSVSNAALPVITTIGGMVGAAVVYLACNWGDADALRGWAIPMATDIAFALGVLARWDPGRRLR